MCSDRSLIDSLVTTVPSIITDVFFQSLYNKPNGKKQTRDVVFYIKKKKKQRHLVDTFLTTKLNRVIDRLFITRVTVLYNARTRHKIRVVIR